MISVGSSSEQKRPRVERPKLIEHGRAITIREGICYSQPGDNLSIAEQKKPKIIESSEQIIIPEPTYHFHPNGALSTSEQKKPKITDEASVSDGSDEYPPVLVSMGYSTTVLKKLKKMGFIKLVKDNGIDIDVKILTVPEIIERIGECPNPIYFDEKLYSNDMILSTYCRGVGCLKNAIFGDSESGHQFCAMHKESDMGRLIGSKCTFKDCGITPSYGYIGGKVLCCKEHSLLDMCVVYKQICEYEGCYLHSSFGPLGGKITHCKLHKLPEEISLCKKYKKCEVEGCNMTKRYGFKDGKAKVCRNHADEDMIDLYSKHCDNPGCLITPYYGFPSQKVTKCAKHRLPGMIKRPNGRCKHCSAFAVYGDYLVALRCEDHKLPDDRNLVERPCISCGLPYILKSESKCENCNPETFKRVRLAKQNDLMNYLDYKGLMGTSTDKMINRGECGRERPDRTFEMSAFTLILECDENQHNDRNCLCEQTRMINITQSYGGLPVYFIRWNPDDYFPENSEDDQDLIKKRYEMVERFIKGILDGRIPLPIALTAAFYMYYDGWSSVMEEEWEILLKYD
jgi:hypothetical protein